MGSGSDTVETTKYTFSKDGLDLGSKKITNIANGTDKNDAINKSQLEPVVTALGGGAKIDTDGTIKSPTYSLKVGARTRGRIKKIIQQ